MPRSLNLLILASAACCTALYGAAWREPRCGFRRSVEAAKGYRCDANSLSFYHAGRSRDDLADLRVYDSQGAVVPHMVLQAGPGDFARIAFRSGADAGRFYLYYGDRQASAPRYSWKPAGGLLLETRRYRGGTPSSIEAMRRIIDDSRPSYGKSFVPNVFHGLNVFGSHTNYVSIYTGTLYAPSSGKYVFCTSSDDASFLLLDGKVVVQWPGWHGAVGDTRHNAPADLSAGAHQFEYLHVNGSGPGIAVAAWQHPSAAGITPIPADAFGRPGTAAPGPVETKGGGGAADFQCEVSGEAVLPDGSYIVKLAFKDTAGVEAETSWDFGDGLNGRGRVTSHIFLAEGDTVIRMSNRYGSCENRVCVERRYWMDMSPQNPLRDFVRTIRGYDFNRMDAARLAKALEIFQSVEDAAGAELVMQAAVERAGDVDASTVAESAVTLSRGMSVLDPAKALQLLTRVQDALAKSPPELARVLLAQADVHFYYLNDDKKALELYDRIVGRFAGKVHEHTVRIAKIRIGDLYRKQKDYNKALRAYTDAERLKINPWPEDRLAVRKGSLYLEVESYLKDGRLDDAASSLDTLEWEYPAERLRGESSLLRGRLALAARNTPEAFKQLLALVDVNPGSEYAAECIFLAALIRRQEGRTDEAKALEKRIVDEYPESPRAAELAG
ncbi:MAG: tetratricopeptide repeat protein [Planctomycetes bacterium]|nr:tetratricopeptide repeat protein [Planctomycetota bacterium]